VIKNYFKVALRNIFRYKSYSLITIAGLAVGLASCFLILLFVQFELSYDRFHLKAPQIYRLALDHGFIAPGQAFRHTGTCAPLASALLKEFPEIKDAVRMDSPFRGNTQIFVRKGEEWIKEEKFLLADSSLFSIFSFPFLKGDPEKALQDPYSLVLTEEMAQKYFESEDPIGKMISIQRRDALISAASQSSIFDFKVTGVLKNIPSNSHFHFDFVIPFTFMNTLYDFNYLENWHSFNFVTYILLHPEASPADLEKKFPVFVKKYMGENERQPSIFLQPLTRIHLYSHLFGEIEATSDVKYLYYYSIIGILILIIACINFTNLSTARASLRTREVGMRKVVGAQRKQLINQFLSESVVLALLALPLAIVLAELFLPLFNSIVNRSLAIRYFADIKMTLAMIAITLLAGLISGIYPAFLISAYQPVRVLKGISERRGGRSLVRSILVVTQFAFSIFFISLTLLVVRQLSFVRQKDLGFDREFVGYLNLPSKAVSQQADALKSELLKNYLIRGVAVSNHLPFKTIEKTSIWWESAPQDTEVNMNGIGTDSDFLATMGIPLVSGKNFSSGQSVSYLLNEAALKTLGWKTPGEAIGRPFQYGTYPRGEIVGVVRDFHYKSLYEKIEPLVIHNSRRFTRFLLVKIGPGNLDDALQHMRKVWKSFEPDIPFEFVFLDDYMNTLYQNDQRTRTIFAISSFLTIFIASLGLFNLASFSVIQRTKEIGIRKVLGASVSRIVAMLCRDFVRLVILANVIAWPLAYFAMSRWLQNFAYRVNISLIPFILSAVLAFFAALVTIFFHSLKTALANPVESLRYE
jgi:putative ABC transport system permease protein